MYTSQQLLKERASSSREQVHWIIAYCTNKWWCVPCRETRRSFVASGLHLLTVPFICSVYCFFEICYPTCQRFRGNRVEIQLLVVWFKGETTNKIPSNNRDATNSERLRGCQMFDFSWIEFSKSIDSLRLVTNDIRFGWGGSPYLYASICVLWDPVVRGISNSRWTKRSNRGDWCDN